MATKAALDDQGDGDAGSGQGSRDAAASAGKLAPLEMITELGAELEAVMKADPLAFDRQVADKVSARDPYRTPPHHRCPQHASALGGPAAFVSYTNDGPCGLRKKEVGVRGGEACDGEGGWVGWRRRWGGYASRGDASSAPDACEGAVFDVDESVASRFSRRGLKKNTCPSPLAPCDFQLRALATEVLHPSFPGGRSGFLRRGVVDPMAGSGGTDATRDVGETEGAEGDLGDFDLRYAGGLHKPPHPAAPVPEYLQLEGWKNAAGDEYVPNEAADRALLRELAGAVGRSVKVQRRREVQDILYLQVVHRFNTVGVPLAPDLGHYRGPGASPSISPHPSRHAKKIRRLIEQMLPPGAEVLLEKHLDLIIRNVDNPEVSGKVGSSGLPTVCLAQVYSQSAAYGYFLQVVSRRLKLEHSFRDGAAVRSILPVRNEQKKATAATMAKKIGDAKSSKEDMESLASNVVGALPPFPPAIGDWVQDDEDEWWEEAQTAYDRYVAKTLGDSVALHEEIEKEQKKIENDYLAASPAYPAYPAAIGDWLAPDEHHYLEEDDEEQEEEPAVEMYASLEPIEEHVPKLKRLWSGIPLAPIRTTSLDETHELQTFVEAMDPSLRAAAATVAGVETSRVLENHVEALFGSAAYLSSRVIAALDPDGIFDSDAVRAARVRAGAMSGDVDVTSMPLDALRYLVIEAAAFGAVLHGAEKQTEPYELIRMRNGREADSDGFPKAE